MRNTFHIYFHIPHLQETHRVNVECTFYIPHLLDEAECLQGRFHSLQHTATHCNTLQHSMTHCNTRHWYWRRHCVLWGISTHCNTLQHTATHCNTALWEALRVVGRARDTEASRATHCNTLQHTATHCNTLQHTATHCNTATGRGFACGGTCT